MKPVSNMNNTAEENKMESKDDSQKPQGSINRFEKQGRSNQADSQSDFTENLSSKFQDAASNVSGKVQEYGEQALEKTSSFVRKYPAPMALAGFGLGIVLGLTLARRS